MSTAFTNVFAVYLKLLHLVNTKISTALHCDSPNYRRLHSCPAFQYKLVGEKSLPYDILLSIDEGSYLKCFAKAGSAAELLQLHSDYFIERDTVNAFKKKAKPKAPKPTKPKKKGKGKAKEGV